MNKNQVFTGEITGITSQGLGVARFEDRAVFVKGAITGEDHKGGQNRRLWQIRTDFNPVSPSNDSSLSSFWALRRLRPDAYGLSV